jgi:sugar/nucleoside kinase (ribokinase family)
MPSEKVILVVGSCGLDRLLTVPNYPVADAKIRTTGYHEGGGGNAANTAHTMALLSDALYLQDSNVRIKLLSKVGDDDIGRRLAEELTEAGVDLASPLFLTGPKQSTTAVTTIIVSALEHTRTCIHTPGTCGELVLDDLDNIDMDEVFANVVHIHSDCRHLKVASVLAREARDRRIPISVDAEKDRHVKSMDDLLELATLIFTNSTQLEPYFQRRIAELKGTEHDDKAEKINISSSVDIPQSLVPMYAGSVGPSRYFSDWLPQSSVEREVVITQGSLGSLHVKCGSSTTTSHETHVPHALFLASEHSTNNVLTALETVTGIERSYAIQSAGVMSNLHIIDTTGAGDAFIGGYLISQLACSSKNVSIQFSLNFGSWVAGRKLEGPGARSALPGGSNVDANLGITAEEIEIKLSCLTSSFGSGKK